MKKAKSLLTIIAAVYLALCAPMGFASWLHLLNVPEHARPFIAAPVTLLMLIAILEILIGYARSREEAAS